MQDPIFSARVRLRKVYPCQPTSSISTNGKMFSEEIRSHTGDLTSKAFLCPLNTAETLFFGSGNFIDEIPGSTVGMPERRQAQ